MNKDIKTEEPAEEPANESIEHHDYHEYNGGPSTCLSPNHPDLQPDTLTDILMTADGKGRSMHPDGGQQETKPSWVPSSKGRSIVWEHITWQAESQRAACNYCQAEFQIKGGTSALLRHLKTIHPAAINFDPENPPPVVRRKRKKMEDYTVVTEDTKSYMDNLLEQFLQDENAPRSSSVHHEPQSSQSLSMKGQTRADSEIDEVIRNLQKESAQNGEEDDEELRLILGISEENEEIVAPVPGAPLVLPPTLDAQHFVAPPPQPPMPPIHENGQINGANATIVANLNGSLNAMVEEEKQQSAKKRKHDNVASPAAFPIVPFPETLKHGKLNVTMMTSARRPVPHPIGQQPSHVVSGHLPPPPPPLHATTSSGMTTAAIAAKYNANAVGILDLEAKVLYNQSMHSTIAREDAMATYYRMKSRKLELEIKKLERELEEGSRPGSPNEEQETIEEQDE